MSADGSKLIATAFADKSYNPGRIYTSADFGLTWLPTSAPSNGWSSVASTPDGKSLVASAYFNFFGQPGQIYTSKNSGSTWTATTAPVSLWQSVASSSDGTKLMAAGDQIYLSIDSGVTWTNAGAPFAHWLCGAMSANGSQMVAASDNSICVFPAPILPLPVTLVITNDAQDLRIYWPVSAAGATLYQSADCGGTNWVPVSAETVVTNGQNEIVLPAPTSGSLFFRLQSE
jgi:hypothetical protein